MRGYFGIGIEGVSKPMNFGSLLRTAHAFGASFAFAIAASFPPRVVRAAYSSAGADNLPLHLFDGVADFKLPEGCQLVGIELIDDAIPLPSFRHPRRAAYVLGAERASLSPALLERCAFVCRIPTRFCLNVGLAGALVMYDRMISLGRFAERPVRAGSLQAPLSAPAPGDPIWMNKSRPREAAAG